MTDQVLEQHQSPSMPFGQKALTWLVVCTAAMIALWAGVKILMSKLANSSRLDYKNQVGNALVGFFDPYIKYMHQWERVNFDLPKDTNFVTAIGPHRTGIVDGCTVAMALPQPIRYFATDAYNHLPFAKSILDGFHAITVLEGAREGSGKNRNQVALEAGIAAAKAGDCVGLFPEGSMRSLKEPNPTIKPGVAKIAIAANIPIVVLRLDGMTSLDNPWFPASIRNSKYYTGFMTFLLPNKVKITQSEIIRDHLEKDLSDETAKEAMIELINTKIAAHLGAKVAGPKAVPQAQLAEDKTQPAMSSAVASLAMLSSYTAKLETKPGKPEAQFSAVSQDESTLKRRFK